MTASVPASGSPTGVWRGPAAPMDRFTVDICRKHGRDADDQTYSRLGLILTGDLPAVFLLSSRSPGQFHGTG